MPQYSVIIPVFNRPDEIKEMLDSLASQDYQDMEILIVEDGSDVSCEEIVMQYASKLDLKYFYKPNTGPGDSRNFGMEKAIGNYLLFFDSDCVLPSDYFTKLHNSLTEKPLDAFGGPDAAHESFSNIQKAINYTMTSFFTTGGIRGGKQQVNKFQPRSFNMGMKREVYQKIGGYSNVHPGEDPDLSFRIMDAGYKTGLISEAFVYHKRRIDFKKFALQVYKFGVVRVFLNKWYPTRSSIVYFFPSLFLLGSLGLILAALLLSPIFISPLVFYIGVLWLDACFKTKSMVISLLAIPTSLIQLIGYGYGYLKSQFIINFLGNNERKAFPSFFFK